MDTVLLRDESIVYDSSVATPFTDTSHPIKNQVVETGEQGWEMS